MLADAQAAGQTKENSSKVAQLLTVLELYDRAKAQEYVIRAPNSPRIHADVRTVRSARQTRPLKARLAHRPLAPQLRQSLVQQLVSSPPGTLVSYINADSLQPLQHHPDNTSR